MQYIKNSDDSSISRRQFVIATTASLAGVSLGTPTIENPTPNQSKKIAPANAKIIAGAIRWDAWYRRAGSSIAAQSSLSSIKYFRRAPFYCSVDKRFQVSCVGSAIEMDDEIRAAVKGGLKYWAFDWYSSDSSLRVAWNLYNKSQYRGAINWCGLVGLDMLGSTPFHNGNWRNNIREWAEYMQQFNYQRVNIDGVHRPLLFILWNEIQLHSHFDNDLGNLRACIEYLCGLLTEVRLGAPYIVILGGIDGAPIVRCIGADGIGSYVAAHKTEINGRYGDLAQQTQDLWVKMAATEVPTVPIVQIGWDTRPRQERPVPWERATPNPNPREFYFPPTPKEFAEHVRAAVQFVRAHPESCPSNLLLIYSWNECDEGGGLIPSIEDPMGSYLSAMGSVL